VQHKLSVAQLETVYRRDAQNDGALMRQVFLRGWQGFEPTNPGLVAGVHKE
jgi:hypothetical protein